MSRTAILLSFRTEHQLQRQLPPCTHLTHNRSVRTSKPQFPAPVIGPFRDRGRPRSPVKIAPATPELLEAQRRQRGDISTLSYKSRTIETKQKRKEKKRLKEMERSMTDDMRFTLSREGRTVRRFTFQPEPEDAMIPPTPPPLLPLNTLTKPTPLTEPPSLSEPPPLLPLTPLTKPPSQRNPTHSFDQVRIKTNLARLLLTFELFLVF